MESKQKLGRLITVLATFLAFSGIGVVDPILPIIAEKDWCIALASRDVIYSIYFDDGNYDVTSWNICIEIW